MEKQKIELLLESLRESEQKRAEKTRRETEQKLRNIIENSTNLFYMHDTDRVFTYMSPQSRHFFDCEPEEAMGRWTELITDNPANKAAIEATQRAIDTGERQPPYLVECIGKKGRIIWVEVNESPIVEEGRTVAIVGSLTDISERKRMEAELEHFASFPRLNPAAIIEMDSDGKVTFCNNAAQKILGKMSCLDSSNPLIPGDLPDIVNDLHQGKVSQITRTVELDDLIFDEMIYLAPEFNSVRIHARDATEQRRLEEDRNRLAAIVEHSDDAIIAKTLDGIIVDWNRGAEKLYGYSAAEIKGRHISTLVPADRVDEVTQILEKIGRGETVEPFETIRVTKDGRPFPVLVAVSPIKDRNGRITGVSTIGHDITDRKREEQKLLGSEERLRLAVEATGLGTFDYYPQNGTLIWSDGIRRHFGLPPDAHVDYGTFLAGLHPDDREWVDGINQNLLNPESGGEYSTEYRVIGFQDGKERWIAARGRMFYDGTGRAVRLVGTTLDISARKEAEEKIAELNASLAERAAELVLANQELEAFNYTVAHDLRKPLTVVNGYCQVIKELCGNQLDGQCKEYLQEAYNSTVRMNLLIGDLLKFSQLAHVELRRKTIDLSAMARTVAAELKLAEPGRRVEFRITDGVGADGDAALLRVVLDNLLGNAWKYTGKREEAVIEFGVTEIDGEPVWFVRDNGEGFNMADAEKLFIPFQRLPGAAEFKGFGIGLATVERIIRRHGGKIWAEGEPDKGSTFYFTLQS